jgi:phage shock protein A
MGIFTRVRDIISSNVNAMLDKAEDPEKLIRLMIQEMEDALVEVKASCAGAMAAKKKIQRQLDTTRKRVQEWSDKARLAVDKGREDLAREALLEKKRFESRSDVLSTELTECEAIIEQYQEDIIQLEEKLANVKEKQRILVQRHIHAQTKKRAQQDIRKADTSDAFIRFQKFESRIDRMEAEADLVNYARKPALNEEISKLATDEEIEKELEQLKAERGKQ